MRPDVNSRGIFLWRELCLATSATDPLSVLFRYCERLELFFFIRDITSVSSTAAHLVAVL